MNSQTIFKDNSSLLITFQQLLDPVVAISLLLVLSRQYNIVFDAPHIILAAITVLLILPVFKATGLYRSYRGEALTAEASRILIGWGIVLAILLFLGYCTKSSSFFSRSLLLSWALSVPFVLYLEHVGIRMSLRYLRASGRNTRTAVIAGTDRVGHYLAEKINQTPYLGIKLHGFFSDKLPTTPHASAEKVAIGTLENLPEYVRRHRIEQVYITPSVGQESLAVLLNELQDTTASVYFVPDILMFNLMQARTQEISGIPLVAVWEIPFSDLQHALKRTVDVVLATLALTLLFPVMSLIALGVRLSSPGPILFKQRRYGLNGQEIVVYKFRSMTVAEDGDVVTQAKRNDSRVTRFGALLRCTSLDELPQFINVLQGRMSIVGPRPHAVAHNEQYRKLINGYMRRHKVKPGITGWAQVHGLRGETDTLDKMKQRVEYDLQYLKDWSLFMDLKIIVRTALALFQHTNAY